MFPSHTRKNKILTKYTQFIKAIYNSKGKLSTISKLERARHSIKKVGDVMMTINKELINSQEHDDTPQKNG